MNYDIKSAFTKFHGKVVRVQKAWMRTRSNYNFRAMLLRKMWDRE